MNEHITAGTVLNWPMWYGLGTPAMNKCTPDWEGGRCSVYETGVLIVLTRQGKAGRFPGVFSPSWKAEDDGFWWQQGMVTQKWNRCIQPARNKDGQAKSTDLPWDPVLLADFRPKRVKITADHHSNYKLLYLKTGLSMWDGCRRARVNSGAKGKSI